MEMRTRPVRMPDGGSGRDLPANRLGLAITTRPAVEHMETNLIFSHRQSYLLPGDACSADA